MFRHQPPYPSSPTPSASSLAGRRSSPTKAAAWTVPPWPTGAAQIAAPQQGRQVVLVSAARSRKAWRDGLAQASVGDARVAGRRRGGQRPVPGGPRYGLRTRVLLTHEDLADRHRYLNARSTLFALLRLGSPTKNDTVVTDEIRLGDNDTLGALVTNLIEADTLVILTDQRGLYDSDPRKNPDAKFISHAQAGDAALEAMAGGAGSASAPAAC